MTDAQHPGHMTTPGRRQRRLNGCCPDQARCALLPFACSDLCWRLEGDLIEQARLAGARAETARAGKNT